MATAAVIQKDEAAIPDPWAHLLELPCDLTAELAIPAFKVSDLLRLAPQSIINSQWRVGLDVPLRVNGNLVAWAEIEVVRDRLALRLTEPV
ncbi:MAG TPA: FliM/FliN family flagellar motor C-terminal domain-containing protein [Terriglobales bacterium]|jgi:flagellar motor switch/type III secretory pathway protein FliN